MLPDVQQLPHYFRRPAFWLALLAIFHFTLSCATWGILASRWNITAAELIELGYLPAVITCILLLLASVACAVAAVKWPGVSRWLVAALYAAAIALFIFDLANGHYQLQVVIATTKFWDAGNGAHWYSTWWWYNDRWLRHPYLPAIGIFIAFAIPLGVFLVRSNRRRADKIAIAIVSILAATLAFLMVGRN